jgi:DNA-binding response OmpR family regulator
MALAATRQKRILVVEDHEDSRLGLVRLLQKHGHDARGTATLQAGLGELINWLPEYVVLDLMLPDGLGVQIMRSIREHGFPVRVVVVTATTDPALLAEVAELRPEALMKKPLNLPDLLQWIGPALSGGQPNPRSAPA